ncbi:MAG TPA: guanylate kinase [Rhodocyclaceae bacterium]|nr:MAG: guanylate kinase [Betaproteobacteria bacterium CG2_30_68_42]PIV74799.1 MAG: guanylate kinase [Rhodocyclales bacterium CG17_big_fil_post_rev_8_21_14_2_50_68_7]PJA58295.1 MAG: guanylate kinase [Rhodocyclales bacterium CG_4_9_14_3_um_filter_68_10]HCX33283.1 guanylate kinase [Rhodocyclaceae bacterium]
MPGNLYIVTAPSGAGKTTLVAGLLARDPAVQLSVSYTTRRPRPAEREGVDYHFVSPREFEAMRENGEFLEWAHVHGNDYGTARSALEKQTAAGADVILEIDWQGARQMRRAFPGAVGVFILPPAFEELERRLRARGQDPEDVIRGRIDNAREEISHVAEFDYVIINRDLETAIEDLAAIVRASRLRFGVQARRSRAHFAFSGN